MANVPPSYGGNKLESASFYFAITASDTVNFDYAVRAIYVGGAGNLVAVRPDGTAVTFTAVPAGSILPINAIRVNSTNTTASSLTGMC